MNEELTFTALALSAVSIGALHSLAPDHWLPFATLARARGWSRGRTARLTLACGVGHVTVTVLLGLLGLGLGVELASAFGSRLESVAGVVLIAFGLTYAAWALHRRMAPKLGKAEGLTVGGLFAFFCLDPCVAAIPLLFLAAPLGLWKALAVVLLYEAATLVAMVALAVPARDGLVRLGGAVVDRWAHAAAGGSIAAVGLAMAFFG